MFDWLIVGGGVHGTYLSFYLTRVKGVARDSLRVLDPEREPMARWKARAANTGMGYLRSPHAHNMDHDPWSIVTFAATKAGKPLAAYIPTNNRPSMALFTAHTRWLIDRHALDQLRVVGRADGLERVEGGWRVSYGDDSLDARQVILAFGLDDNAHWPDWARTLRDSGGTVDHIFTPGFDRAALPEWKHIAVIGGGITAAQTALALSERQPGTITLLMRHSPRIHDFDSDLGWIKGALLQDFEREPDFDRRAAIIRGARFRGSMPPDVYAALQAAVEAGRLEVRQTEVVSARRDSAGIQLDLKDGDVLTVNRVVLATGFDPARPGGAWLDRAIAAYGLPVAASGYPIVDPALRWADGLFVSGPLAELMVGPTARNIVGARLAAERIATTIIKPQPHGQSRAI